ncbi:MAG: DUF3536 domain-containing protein [Deltaproteobacteria bacterium]
MSRFICIHGHFYQPPRENPWLEEIERQDSAHPFHDWNERITSECYAQNASSRILGDDGSIVEIVNNYSKISFNFGPTLLDWLERKSPDAYRAILDADRESRKNFRGHGSALAQAYNHVIMPLANRRDKFTQTLWGVRNFERHFQRKPEGMWLPECAVDLETLEVLAELGIRFTILSPYQAARSREAGGAIWRDASGGRVNTRVPYRVSLPSGRSIAVFFYDGALSRAVAFEGALSSGERFAERLAGGFSEDGKSPELVHIATDGESYGHHHRRGDMGLAYAARHIESKGLARITNYGEFLEMNPPAHEARIFDGSSWSCHHGIERWRADCGCNSGGRPLWNQLWRTPLREALDWLRDEICALYEEGAGELLRDSWAARNDYISVVGNRAHENVERFLSRHACRELGAEEKIRALKLLELQRHAMLMFTSCGWFFDELSGIETAQIIQYAARAVELAEDLFAVPIEERFIGLLGEAKSNIPEHRDGREIYQKFVKPAAVSREKIAAHFAARRLFESATARVYSHEIEREYENTFGQGGARLVLGRARVASEITRESDALFYAAAIRGNSISAGACRASAPEAEGNIIEAFESGDFAGVLGLFGVIFGGSGFTLDSLLMDDQRAALSSLMEAAESESEPVFRQIHSRFGSFMRTLAGLGRSAPPELRAAAEFVISRDLLRVFSAPVIESAGVELIKSLAGEAKSEGVALEYPPLNAAIEQKLEAIFDEIAKKPSDLRALEGADSLLEAVASLPIQIRLWKSQNAYYDIMRGRYFDIKSRAEWGDRGAAAWVKRFASIGRRLNIRTEG